MTIEDLAGMVQNEFNHVDEQLDQVHRLLPGVAPHQGDLARVSFLRAGRLPLLHLFGAERRATRARDLRGRSPAARRLRLPAWTPIAPQADRASRAAAPSAARGTQSRVEGCANAMGGLGSRFPSVPDGYLQDTSRRPFGL